MTPKHKRLNRWQQLYREVRRMLVFRAASRWER
jgi:hypothetical protein